MFVPSGWGHQVINLCNTISVNQNWANAYNAPSTIAYLNLSLKEVQLSIFDCKQLMQDPFEFESHCQMLLKCHAGINHIIWYQWFYWILTHELSFMRKLLPDEYQQMCNLPPLDCSAAFQVLSCQQSASQTRTGPRYFHGCAFSVDIQRSRCFINLSALLKSITVLLNDEVIDGELLKYLMVTLQCDFHALRDQLHNTLETICPLLSLSEIN
ncbi:JmjC domain-containing protein 4 [Entomophthora muscae]|uniref:JmjC domain-containing protein 4 n=1 Tax=Entomophthora muscae TaxID=34485 RepID=A0ACC2SJZ6_9FUNG|nr:JmjC domain-containing protein 4 [Entomophthora muscae]